jgi:hypothetical protein
MQPDLLTRGWIEVRDGNATARAIFDRHYSRRRYPDGTTPDLLLGPGEKLVLVTGCARAVFGWRRFISDNDQAGINCAVFRNEGAGLSSELILQAEAFARDRWPDERRLYTYVDPRRVRSTNPGFCFIAAGWHRCGVTSKRRYLILEKTA